MSLICYCRLHVLPSVNIFYQNMTLVQLVGIKCDKSSESNHPRRVFKFKSDGKVQRNFGYETGHSGSFVGH